MTKSLFDKIQIKHTTLKNRFVRSATWEGMCDNNGHVTSQLIDCYRMLAGGGAGLIISGYSYIRDDGKQMPGKMGISQDSHIKGLKELTEAVHQEGGVIFCQLVHAGGQTTGKMIGVPPLVPSVTEYAGYQDTTRELTTADIKAIVTAFGEAAGRAKTAGFDGIQLHGAHGYLINQFLSPLCNRREDEYGGSLTNRMRFLEEVLDAVRAAVGEDYPVTIKLTASDHIDGGLQIADCVVIAKHLEKFGIDAIEVSSGTPVSGQFTPVRQKIDTPEKEAYNSDLAHKIKREVDVPIILVGGLRSGGVMQKLLSLGYADMFAFSRPLIREPDLPAIFNSDDTYVSRCISCNKCFSPAIKGDGIYCVLDQNKSADTSFRT